MQKHGCLEEINPGPDPTELQLRKLHHRVVSSFCMVRHYNNNIRRWCMTEVSEILEHCVNRNQSNSGVWEHHKCHLLLEHHKCHLLLERHSQVWTSLSYNFRELSIRRIMAPPKPFPLKFQSGGFSCVWWKDWVKPIFASLEAMHRQHKICFKMSHYWSSNIWMVMEALWKALQSLQLEASTIYSEMEGFSWMVLFFPLRLFSFMLQERLLILCTDGRALMMMAVLSYCSAYKHPSFQI